ncbi:MAG: DoxX family protein [Chitinophagaceae bacterium]|nr:DoxX family protein [Chitinophagaceae bacterium]
MNFLVQLIRFLVGALFIFSGLVKANDPMGLSYKMQEFFELWHLQQWNEHTRLMSVLMNAFEITAGFALWLGWRKNLFLTLTAVLILFFTFLTGYTYITGTPKNCGCFGECIPISSKVSFLKDVALTAMIAFLWIQRKKIKPILPEKPATGIMFLITLFSFGFQWYTLSYLPVVDCLPFRKGKNIIEQMKVPAHAIPDSTVITFVYKKDGKEVEFTADRFPDDFNPQTYEFVRRYDRVVRKGKNNEPPIKGFVLTGITDSDSTQFVLQQPYSVLLFIEQFSRAGTVWQKPFADVYAALRTKNIPAFLITAEPDKAKTLTAKTPFADIQVLKCDYKLIQTAARTPVCAYLLSRATVVDKWSGKRLHLLRRKVEQLPVLSEQLPPVTDSLKNADFRDTTARIYD